MLLFLLTLSSDEDRTKLIQIEAHYKGLMYATTLKVLKNKTLAEDVVQDALINILLNIEKIDEIKCTKTTRWVVCITKRLALNKHKYEKRKRHQSDASYDFIPGNGSMVEEQVLKNEKYADFKKKLSTISKKNTEVLMLKHYFGYSDLEVSQLLAISIDAVRQRAKRGKGILRYIYEQQK